MLCHCPCFLAQRKGASPFSFARAKNMDLSKAGDLIGKVLNGNTTILNRYGVRVKEGATAQEAGGAIHTDIQKGFIRAEIIGYDDFIAAGGETNAKHANKMRVETKSYVMQDYDLANFRFKK